MSAMVSIDMAAGVASTNVVQLLFGQAEIALGANQGVSCSIIGIANIAITPESVTFATVTGGCFNGSLAMALQLYPSEEPTITLNNLVPGQNGYPATISWPTASGLQTQILTPGNPLTLCGIVSS
ncbi:hypothetical protein P1X14_19780 [Sphingomonas sp. AOB5]|uniref:hypothetical protein n=1 Tax=Sphingomonas sp. AOB5 TaxID=3034017 RepID=UPI0023F7EB93|nr:hypothetical protein [Sphingomonas sp. AOB5]MDF7777505.1 hypothetical protein [Sphingomonas sp. AOB5]